MENLNERQRELLEDTYRELVFELARMAHGYGEIARNFGLVLSAKGRRKRGIELSRCLPHVRRLQGHVDGMRERITWKMLPRTRRAESRLEEVIAENFLEIWRSPRVT